MKKGKTDILIVDSVYLSYLKRLLNSRFNILYKPGISNEAVLRIIQEKEIKILIIRSVRKLDKIFLSRCNLQFIATYSKGIDHIDNDYANKLGIKIINSEEGNSVSAAEHTIGLIIASLRKFHLSKELIKSGNFYYPLIRRNELFNKTIGIIGFGKVGSLVGKLSRAFGMNVIANDINPAVKKQFNDFRFASLNFLLKNSDIVSLHIPLDEKNKNFFNCEKFSLLQSGTLFVNTSRGDVVDEYCLLRFLEKDSSNFAALDVFKSEPMINKKFLKLNNVILTNHIAGKTVESSFKILFEIANKLNKISLNQG